MWVDLFEHLVALVLDLVENGGCGWENAPVRIQKVVVVVVVGSGASRTKN